MNDPIYMLNALWLKAQGGREKYIEYGAAIAPILEGVGGEVLPNFCPEEEIIGEWDPDVFFFVKYPNKAAFESMATSDAYKKISHLREEAIEKSLLIRCKPFSWTG